MIGRNISHFHISESLGEGGMGQVFKATDRRLQRAVALKMLNPHLLNDPASFQRFQNEAQLSARISHPNVATLYDFLKDGSQHFIVMEYVDGKPLDQLLDLQGKLPAATSAQIAMQVLEGLEAAHDLGITHRDLKPGNIMITKRGFVKLMDFGIARLENAARITRQNSVIGTLEYLAPELIKGEEPSKCSDLYALGVMLFEMVAGKTPFSGESEASVLYKISQGKGDFELAGGDKKLGQIIKKLTNKQPERRFQSTREAIQALERLYSPGKIDTAIFHSQVLSTASEGKGAVKPSLSDSFSDKLPRLSLPKLPQALPLEVDKRIIGITALLCLLILVIGMLKPGSPGAQKDIPEPAADSPTIALDPENRLSSAKLTQPPQETFRPKQLPQEPQGLPVLKQKGKETEAGNNERSKKSQESTKKHRIKPLGGDNSPKESQPVKEKQEETPVSGEVEEIQTPQKENSEKAPEKVVEKEESATPTPVEKPTKYVRFPDLSLSAKLTETLSTEHNAEGQKVYLQTTEATYYSNTLIIAKGAKIQGEIRKLRRGNGGKRAFLSIKLQGIETAAGTWLPVNYPEYSNLDKYIVEFKKGLVLNNIKIKSHGLNFPQTN